jgi:hypothetical protein
MCYRTVLGRICADRVTLGTAGRVIGLDEALRIVKGSSSSQVEIATGGRKVSQGRSEQGVGILNCIPFSESQVHRLKCSWRLSIKKSKEIEDKSLSSQ